MAKPPKPFQIGGVRFILTNNYCLLADDPGLGKTYQAIAAQRCLRLNTLIISPSYLMWNWQSEFLQLSKNPPELAVIASKNKAKIDDKEVYISSYGQLSNLEAFFDWAEFVIIDEAHYVKKPSAQRTKLMRKLLKKFSPSRFLMLTGSPMNKIEDLYNLWKLDSMGPNGAEPITKRFPNVFKFQNTFAHKEYKYFKKRNPRTKKLETKKVAQFSGIKNKEFLKSLMEGRMLRRQSEDVLDLPDQNEIKVQVDFSKKVDDELQIAWEQNKILDGEDEAVATKKANNAYKKAEHTKKLAIDLLDQDPSPIIIFSDHVAPIIQLAHDLGKGRNVAVITGNLDSKDRHDIVKGFQEGKYDFLLATITSAGTGNNLVASSRVIFNDLNWDPEKNKQAKYRIRRIGQKNICQFYYILGGPVDKNITDVLLTREADIDDAIN
jgi:SNF2 family DNA or RNA helicase